ncbi:MAG: hypothetical protein WBW55_07495 [Desulfobaccales bacterium]
MVKPQLSKKNKIAMDSSVLDRCIRFLLGTKDMEFDAILKSGAKFCRLRSNPKIPNNLENYLPDCCGKLDAQAENRIKERIDELKDFHDDPEDRALISEAEEVGIDVLLTRSLEFINNLGAKAKNVNIMTTSQYCELFPPNPSVRSPAPPKDTRPIDSKGTRRSS